MSDTLTLTVDVRDGDYVLTDQHKAMIGAFLRGRRLPVRIEFSKKTDVRSNEQNSYLWGVVYKTIANHTGHTSEEIHAVCKEKFLDRAFVKLGSIEMEVRKSTRKLSRPEFNIYVTRITAWAAQDLGLSMPELGGVPSSADVRAAG